MGKDTKHIQRGETFSRLNFLFQAAHAALVANPQNLELARTYIHSLKAIAEKSVLRLDPSMKRTLCKKCFMLLVPGVTSSIRIRSKRQKHLVIRCLECQTIKRINLNPDYKLWTEQPEAWLNTTPKHTLCTEPLNTVPKHALRTKQSKTALNVTPKHTLCSKQSKTARNVTPKHTLGKEEADKKATKVRSKQECGNRGDTDSSASKAFNDVDIG